MMPAKTLYSQQKNNAFQLSNIHSFCFHMSLYSILEIGLLIFFTTVGVANAAESQSIKIGEPVVVHGLQSGIWNLEQHHLSFSTRAIYCFRDKTHKSYIVRSSISTWPQRRVVTVKYPVMNTKDVAFSPQYSPDGTKVLFNIGWPYDPTGRYQMYLWDLKTNDVHEVRMPFSSFDVSKDTFQNKGAKPFQYSFPIVKWSPNGQYVSYIRGGDIYGHVAYDGHTYFDTFDVQNVIRYFLAKNDGIPYGYSWTPDNNILYSAIENSTIDIYRISSEGKNRKLILKNAYRPTPSPDGSKIAFFGSEHFETPINLQDGYLDVKRPHGLALSVANADGTNRKALNREDLYYPEVIWMPDNKHLITIDPGTTYTSDDGKRTGKMSTKSAITVWDIETGKRRHICDVPAQDIEFINRTNDVHQFTPLQLSPDGKTLYISVSEMIGQQESRYDQRLSVKAIDIKSGNIYDIGHLSNVFDLQWQLVKPDLSSPKK